MRLTQLLRLAGRKGYMVVHSNGKYWTGSRWSSARHRAKVYGRLADLPSEISGYGRESGVSMYLKDVRGGTSYGTYHPWYGDTRKGREKKHRRSPHAYVRKV